MREEFEKLAAAGKLARQHIEPLVQLTSSGYCYHRSWGFGRITAVDTVFARFTIDFPSKPGHTMDLGFAADSLKPISKDHILARKASDLEGLRQLAVVNHLDLVKLVLLSYGGKATLDQIQQVLVPDVIRADWRKWWETAKHELKKDGHFLVPSKKNDPLLYQDKEVSLEDRLLSEFRSVRGLKAKVNAATEVWRNLPDLKDPPAVAAQIIGALNADIPMHQRTQPAAALEAIFIRDDLAGAAAVPPQPNEVSAQQIWAQGAHIGEVLADVPVSKHRRVLETFKQANPHLWHEAVLTTLNQLPAKLCSECANLLIQEGKLDALKVMLARLISQHKASSDLLLWLAKERTDSFADILGPEVFRAMMTAIERDQFNERKSNRLRDFVLDDQDLLVELIGSADLEVIKDLTRSLQLSPIFEDMDKRSLLARIVKSYPAIQMLITGEQTKQDTALLVSWASLERRKKEYDELVHKKIPANSREIALARSYGDLSENHEYKAAKEMQKILMRRKAELESQLLRARGTDFAGARADLVSIGTRVTVTELDTQHSEAFTILGAWDSEPDQGVISYLSPVAQSLLNQPAGTEVEFDAHGSKKRYRIDAIEPCQAPPPAAPPPETATPPSLAPETAAPPDSTLEAAAPPALVPEAAIQPAAASQPVA